MVDPDENQGRKYGIKELLTLMDRLRDPNDGCPWDLKQSFQTIVPHTIEETYEVVDAIERQDWPHLMDELGDLLFQVVFYARLGKEDDSFDWHDIVDNVVRKLLRRHPHVFPQGTLESRLGDGEVLSEAAINANWERIKAEEKKLKEYQESALSSGSASILNDIPAALPAMTRALKLQKRAASAGFDWDSVAPVIAKVREELDELEEAMNASEPNHEHVQEEFGDILFTCANLARFIKVEPEMALRRTNDKFVQRFQRIEVLAEAQGKGLESMTLDELDALWNKAKIEEIQR